MNPRIAPVDAPYQQSIAEDFKAIMPSGMPPLAIFRTIAHNPRVLHRMVLGNLLDRGSISLADRELVILRVCALTGAEYEWGVHVAGFASKAGFSAEQIAATNHRTIDSSLWQAQQQCVLKLADELFETQTLSDALWHDLAQHYSAEQLVELVILAGSYHSVSLVVNAFQIQNEGFAPEFPNSRDL